MAQKYDYPLNKSKGILDDFAVRKNVASREGTIEKVPINNSDIVNKLALDTAIAGGGSGSITNLDGGNSDETFISIGMSPIDGGDST